MAMSSLMKREGYEARPHGFRSTFRTWVEEKTDTPFEVKESALAHHVDAGVVSAYQRSDRLDSFVGAEQHAVLPEISLGCLQIPELHFVAIIANVATASIDNEISKLTPITATSATFATTAAVVVVRIGMVNRHSTLARRSTLP